MEIYRKFLESSEGKKAYREALGRHGDDKKKATREIVKRLRKWFLENGEDAKWTGALARALYNAVYEGLR